MPAIYLRKELHEEIVRRGKDVGKFVNDAVKEALERQKRKGKGK